MYNKNNVYVRRFFRNDTSREISNQRASLTNPKTRSQTMYILCFTVFQRHFMSLKKQQGLYSVGGALAGKPAAFFLLNATSKLGGPRDNCYTSF